MGLGGGGTPALACGPARTPYFVVLCLVLSTPSLARPGCSPDSRLAGTWRWYPRPPACFCWVTSPGQAKTRPTARQPGGGGLRRNGQAPHLQAWRYGREGTLACLAPGWPCIAASGGLPSLPSSILLHSSGSLALALVDWHWQLATGDWHRGVVGRSALRRQGGERVWRVLKGAQASQGSARDQLPMGRGPPGPVGRVGAFEGGGAWVHGRIKSHLPSRLWVVGARACQTGTSWNGQPWEPWRALEHNWHWAWQGPQPT